MSGNMVTGLIMGRNEFGVFVMLRHEASATDKTDASYPQHDSE